MNTFLKGVYEITCVLLNSETVVNNDGLRRLEIQDNAWVLQPAGQAFEIEQLFRKTAILRSNGKRYFAETSRTSEKEILLRLKREHSSETISIEAELTSYSESFLEASQSYSSSI